MNQSIILFVGFSRIDYIKSLVKNTLFSKYIFVCAYNRDPFSQTQENYLKYFDYSLDLRNNLDRSKLLSLKNCVKSVTCTQEKDIVDYINVICMLGKISNEQKKLYLKLIDKKTFKDEISSFHPDLTPSVELIKKPAEVSHYPVVIKKLGYSGSKFVSVVHNKLELKRYLSTTQTTNDEGYIVEEYLPGPQFSVNAYVDSQGNAVICPITRVEPAFALGGSDTYSAIQYITTALTTDEYLQLKKRIAQIIKHFKVRNCSLHFDIIKHKTSFKFIEVGMRIGGLRQELFERSSNFSHIENDILNRLGVSIQLPPLKKYVSIVQKGAPSKGILLGVDEIYPSKQNHFTVDKRLKDKTNVAKVENGGTVVYRVFLTAKSEQEVRKKSLNLYEHTIINVTSA